MKKFITSSLLTLIGLLLDSRLFNYIHAVVKEQYGLDKTGAEKKAAVEEALHALGGNAAMVFAKTSTHLINLAIEGVVAYLAARSGDEH